jgi:hypothetical protein
LYQRHLRIPLLGLDDAVERYQEWFDAMRLFI